MKFPHPIDLVLLCRPRHWVKNGFVVLPLVFSVSFASPAKVIACATAVICFCLFSSGVYAINDTLDVENDRRHPRKRLRPVAAGRVGRGTAAALGTAAIAAGALLGFFALPTRFTMVGAIYIGNSLLYCLLVKNLAIVDVISIAIGFIMRLLAGCAAIDVEPTTWLLVCGFSLALFLGFGKRRTEIVNLGNCVDYRRVLLAYDAPKLDVMLSICCSCCLMSYLLYCVAPETVALHHTKNLIYTVPFVAYGLFRYVFKTQDGTGDGPVEVLLSDSVFILNGVLWIISTAIILVIR